VLVNLIARRVRQLNSGGGSGRPLITETAGLGAADIALHEIIEEKMSWQLLESADQKAEAPTKKRKRS
ncbi:MAG: DNA-directed RNA polymerase subunit omega, partial [Verrucomicrobia bacterium]|nr:DNA-directed RNA polymerase subunit omega [Verrucomicrobiota bacterium]